MTKPSLALVALLPELWESLSSLGACVWRNTLSLLTSGWPSPSRLPQKSQDNNTTVISVSVWLPYPGALWAFTSGVTSVNSLKSYKPFYLPLLWIMWLSGISTVIVLMASFLFKGNEKIALFSLSMKKGVEETWRGMYFWITEVVPYLRNGIWPLPVRTNSIQLFMNYRDSSA